MNLVQIIKKNVRTRSVLGLLALILASFGLYRYRRILVARLLKLPPPKHRVGVKRNIRVPMPDGVGLMTDHYFPKANGTFPTILLRSVYGRGAEVSLLFRLFSTTLITPFVERGYHVIVQTTRGRFDSEGETLPFIDAEPDGQATINWIARRPWFDGNLAMWGASYLSYAQWAVASKVKPYLKALAPSVISSQIYPIMFPDGAFGLDVLLRWMFVIENLGGSGRVSTWKLLITLNPIMIGRRLSKVFQQLPLIEADIATVGYRKPFFREHVSRSDPDDPYWQATNYQANLEKLSLPVHLISGWYDFMLRELLADYATLKDTGRTPFLTIGPWTHMNLSILLHTVREGVIWFEAKVKGDETQLRSKPVRVYVMGANNWRELTSWPPPARTVCYFLTSNSQLSRQIPELQLAPDQFLYDPADPTPSLGGPMFMELFPRRNNRMLEARPDVCLFTSPQLQSDLEIMGTVRLELFVKSSLPHTDFFGRVCDVCPSGRSLNVCDGLLRIEPGVGAVQPDGTLHIVIDLWATAYRFKRGHRLRLQISSGAHPRWARNLGTGESIATGVAMRVAKQTIFHDRCHPSALVLPVVDGASTLRDDVSSSRVN